MTDILFFSKLTLHACTPGKAETLFSTRAEQAAQVMPVTSYTSCTVSLLSADTHTPWGYLYSQYNAGIAACQEGGKKCLGSAAEKSPPAAGGRG